jgi:nuclear pore complex protein Nup133
MATFSPSPAPRLRVQNRGNSPIKRSHRLAATPTFTSNDGNSTTSAMDVDERTSTITDRSLSRIGGDVLFAKTDEMSVLFYASLPLEVKQILRVSGMSATRKISIFASFINI